MREPLLVSREDEIVVIDKIIKDVKIFYPELDPSNTVVVMVSPDYSATVAMHMAHGLSKDGEMCEMMMIDVPYPDQDKGSFILKLHKELLATKKIYKNYILTEAGIIRGGNYTWICDVMREHLSEDSRIITTTMYENIHSIFKSDVVGEVYDDKVEDLTFYYEQYNKHWD